MLLGKRWLVPALVGGAALAYAYHRGQAHGHADGERLERSRGHGHGRHRYSARNATLYDAVTAPVLGGFFTRAAQDLAALAPQARVLEIGSGPGRLAAKLAALAPEVQVTGVDIAPEMVARANALAARSGVADRVAFRIGDVAAHARTSLARRWVCGAELVGQYQGIDGRLALATGCINIVAWSSDRCDRREFADAQSSAAVGDGAKLV